MAIVSVDELKAHLGWTDALGTADDDLMAQKIAAAQGHAERLLGFKIEERFEEAADVPPAIKEAVLQLAAWWFDQREAGTDNVREAPFGVTFTLREYQDWAF